MRLVTDVALKIIRFFFFFYLFLACVSSKGFLSLAINLNFYTVAYLFFRFQFTTIDPSHLSTEHSVTNKLEQYFAVILL